jgi:DNA-binding transcriptional MerR regulator
VSAGQPSRALLSIGEVLGRLRGDFPDITISKIRYLETEGLVEPHRSPSGYRKFSTADVERLRYILRQQRDSYLPLRKIREHLDDLDRGLTPAPEGGPPRVPQVVLTDDGYPSAEAFAEPMTELRLTRAELVEAADVGEDLLESMLQYGLVRPRPGQSIFDGSAVVIARTVAELAAYGLEPRHLRAFRTAADREVGLFEQIVSPQMRSRDPSSRARAEQTVRELAALSVRLHTTLVKNALRQSG